MLKYYDSYGNKWQKVGTVNLYSTDGTKLHTLEIIGNQIRYLHIYWAGKAGLYTQAGAGGDDCDKSTTYLFI